MFYMIYINSQSEITLVYLVVCYLHSKCVSYTVHSTLLQKALNPKLLGSVSSCFKNPVTMIISIWILQ